MDSTDREGAWLEWPANLANSSRFRMELEVLVEEFAKRIGTLAEECSRAERLH